MGNSLELLGTGYLDFCQVYGSGSMETMMAEGAGFMNYKRCVWRGYPIWSTHCQSDWALWL